MNIEDIIANKQRLDEELQIALSTMEKKDTLYRIWEQMVENQKQCPHYSARYNFTWTDNRCPYCGKAIKGEHE